MVETQKKIAEVVALRKYKGIDKIKELSNDIIGDLAGFSADEFNMTLGIKNKYRSFYLFYR